MPGGTQIPLSAVASVQIGQTPISIAHDGQFPSSTISFNLPEGAALNETLVRVRDIAASLGMPGCTLYVGLDVLTQFATPSSTASVPYSLPSTPALNGVLLLSQTATISPGLNSFGFITSNALQMVLGSN